MPVDRRQILKLAAASVAAAIVAGPLAGCTEPHAAAPAGAAPPEVVMKTRLLMVARFTAAAPQMLGAGPRGTRLTFPVTGADFEGPRLRGRVLGGGADWGLIRADGVLELSLRVALETDDGARISMTFDAVRHGPPDVIAALGRGEKVDPAAYYFRSVPRFEAAGERYAFLNRIVAVGAGETTPTGAIHTFHEVL